MQDPDMGKSGVHGDTYSAMALDASLSRDTARSYDSDRQQKSSGESDPIRGLRNGLIISIAMWAALYFIVQLILR